MNVGGFSTPSIIILPHKKAIVTSSEGAHWTDEQGRWKGRKAKGQGFFLPPPPLLVLRWRFVVKGKES